MKLARYVVVRLWTGTASYAHPSRTDFTSITQRRAQRFAMRSTLSAPPGMWYEAWPITEFEVKEAQYVESMERLLESDREYARIVREAVGETGETVSRPATPADLLAAVRGAVESGTIEGEVVETEDGFLAQPDDGYTPYFAGEPGTYLVIPLVERGEGGNK